MDNERNIGSAVIRGAAAGLAGTVVMTAFQRLVEMPITGRGESDAPLRLVERVLPIGRRRGKERRLLNYVTHFGVGLAWGAGHGALQHATGVRGQRAVALVFGTLCTGDVVLNTALRLSKPLEWSAQDWIVDVGDKLVLAEATTAVYDRLAGSPA